VSGTQEEGTGIVRESEGSALAWGQEESGRLQFLKEITEVWYSGKTVKSN